MKEAESFGPVDLNSSLTDTVIISGMKNAE